MPNWHDLDRNRWDWSKEAIMRLRAELRGIDEAIEHTDLAHVMVIGDTNVGKTSLLLRLLGVTDPVAAEQAAAPLRGGRDRAESATAVPIRYQWSGDQDSWSLVHGAQRHTERLSSAELEAKLASFRTGEGDHLQWDPADRPLEIGLPERLAGPFPRRDLRVFDLPGLHAPGDQERDVARALVAAYAPVMNFIVFVLPGDQFAEVVRDPAITENPFLASWNHQPERFHLVFTRAFSNAKVREHLVAHFSTGELAAWWLTDPAGDHELAHALIDGACADRITAEHATLRWLRLLQCNDATYAGPTQAPAAEATG